MESAPLTLAYTHARNAAQETKRSNPVAASEEHDLAATEFAAAAQSTTDKEALRVLRLLELHHRQLGQILKDVHSKPVKSSETQKELTKDVKNKTEAENPTGRTNDTGVHPPRLSRNARSTGRDLSSSIASNLASARGIPNSKPKRNIPVSPLVSNAHADGTLAQNSLDTRSRNASLIPSASRPTWAPPAAVTANASVDSTISDAPFQQFYSKFEGLLSSLTAPLAFASLPLTQTYHKDEPTNKNTVSPSKVAHAHSSKSDTTPPKMDYSSIISPAALRAVRDNNPSLKPHESFIYVPTSGGTMSYADITAQAYIDRQISRQEHTREHTRSQSANSADDFVDASSQILPGHDRALGAAAQPKFNGKTMEELQLENTVLKNTTNDMARRLMNFEFNAQNSSAALAQSIRSLHLSPVTTPENSRGKMASISGGHGSDAAVRGAQKRIEELEELVQKHVKRSHKRDDENAKLKEQIARYKEKWEGLKANAKARREQSTAAAGGTDKVKKTAVQSEASSTTPVTDTPDIKDGDAKSVPG